MTEPESIDQHLAAALRAQRPAPGHDFGAGLRERLIALRSSADRPARLWTLVATYTGSGALLLLLAALGASGGGPFGS